MKKIYMLAFALLVSACYGIENEEFAPLSPITFNDAPSVINVNIGEELVFDALEVKSEKPVEYEWSFGRRKQTGDIYEMADITLISNEPEVRYTFNRVGTYILRLKVDNGEDIQFKYFTLNVNSGMDEGLLILCSDESGKGSLSFIKERTPEEVEADAQEIYPDVFSLINPDQTLMNPTDIYLSVHEAKDVQYRSLLVSTNDAEGSIFKLEPKTFEFYNRLSMKSETGASCLGFAGDAASGTTYNYAFMVGDNGHTYRYDLFGDFVVERADATATALVDKAFSDTYHTSSTAVKATRKPILYNENMLIQPVNAKVTKLAASGYRIVNLCSSSTKNLLYVLLESESNPGTYCIKSSTGTLGSYKAVLADFTLEEGLKMDRNSIMVNSFRSADVYYSFDNAVYRWGLTSKPATTPKIILPEGEQIVAMCTNYMGAFTDESGEVFETLLYIATYNPARSGKKGSVYIYKFKDDSLIKSYEGICDKPVKLLWKYRIS